MKNLFGLLLAASVLSSSGLLHATSIPVTNGDFSSGDFVTNDGNPSSTLPDFTTVHGSYYGILDGEAFANGDGSGSTTFTTDTLNTTIAANTTYTLTIDIGYSTTNGGTYVYPNDATLGFLANGTLIGDTAVTQAQILANAKVATDPGTSGAQYVAPFSYSFTTGATGGFIGEDLEATFSAYTHGESPGQTRFDNLTVDSVPEPSAWAMMIAGVLMLVGWNARPLRD
jgi:hypothetical protein